MFEVGALIAVIWVAVVLVVMAVKLAFGVLRLGFGLLWMLVVLPLIVLFAVIATPVLLAAAVALGAWLLIRLLGGRGADRA